MSLPGRAKPLARPDPRAAWCRAGGDGRRRLTVGFGIGAAVLLVTGGALFLAGYGRKQRSRSITWTPRISGVEVAF